ncbi:hydroxyacid dehydrogenase [Streptomyces iconiensis]|uniref:Hydroxyacid dehydrogenase n=2 Tax=Streptomyces iconiensis TaxID=1384038 RepID=A0ABT6ZXD2_9ACTN|nr:hydroxyacid dehydrogenase [Streptomyces iconiensis]MDJ1133512.1 hydroxyacid dehydrogenase [Streptomyces iconiensis]
MDRRVASVVLKAPVWRELASVTELAPLVLDDFGTVEARGVLAEVEVLVTGWGCPVLDAEVLGWAPRLRGVVHTAGSIKGHVTDACWARGVEVSSAAVANAVPVAEYTVAMVLLAGKRVLEAAREYKSARARGDWLWPDPLMGNYRRTVGVLSASLIGRRVIELLRPHDLDVLLYDPYVDEGEAAALGARKAELGEVFAVSDVVSVHAPLLEATRGLVSRELLAALRDDATVINTARGAVVDQEALTDEVRAGRLRAVLDVTEPEVLAADHPLWDCPNALLTPHIAGSQGNELDRLADFAIAEVRRWVAGEGFAHGVRRDRKEFLA